MPEPISTGGATLVVTGAAVPVLVLWGVDIGLRADVLLAGFFGAVAAVALLNTVPSTGDTWRELVRTTVRRVCVTVGSAAVAGYLAPGMAPAGTSLHGLLAFAFVIGAGAQQALSAAVNKLKAKEGGAP